MMPPLMLRAGGAQIPPPPILYWNPADSSASFTLENANLDAFNRNASGTTANAVARALPPKSAGKWYFEFEVFQQGSLVGEDIGVGVESASLTLSHYVGELSKSAGYWRNGSRYVNGTQTSGGSIYSFAPGDVIGIAFDASTGGLWFRKNGTWVGADPTSSAIATVAAGAPYVVVCTLYRPGWGCRIRNTLTYSLPAGFSRWA